MAKCFALMGWSLPVIESMRKLNKPYVVVSYPDFEGYAKENDIPFVSYQFNEWSDSSNSLDLKEKLDAFGADVAVPLFEETVEWAGALNSLYRDDPRVLNRAFLFRNKAMMKRKALIGGLRVGLFEEVYNKEGVKNFMNRLNQANLQIDGEEDSWVHIKPFASAGTVGHRLLRSQADVDAKCQDDDFPCLAESHLPGKEFSCEAFIHGGKIRFMNITEYVKLGYSNFIPEGNYLHTKRDKILKEMQKLVDLFGIQYGMIHPEWFLTENDELSFGEVACRIPGGHILELCGQAYGFDALGAFVLCHDPDLSEEELKQILPPLDARPKTFYGNVMIYPHKNQISKLIIPEELKEESYFLDHNLVPPLSSQKISDREGFGNHFGTVNFKGDDPDRMTELLLHYENVDFYH
ncbi:ATP-grasp domain-containing protein [Cyclobacterium jeungdonense]|uniref:Carboxylate--amine ligase n=1 Tax=Cyclobacterium jeungdonense TaxID=708087 RepID=A0ABT8CDR1_9BACT|nr:carboxylate--amine ligase [Cyclobacterium jeungdonense]MDN3689928.1 carboxylate--amine ligase [Cyclobacterium jeungdonense]